MPLPSPRQVVHSSYSHSINPNNFLLSATKLYFCNFHLRVLIEVRASPLRRATSKIRSKTGSGQYTTQKPRASNNSVSRNKQNPPSVAKKKYYKWKLHERDAKSEQVEYSLYIMVNRLKKQLEEKDKQLQESNTAISELKATLDRRCKEIREIKRSEAKSFKKQTVSRKTRNLPSVAKRKILLVEAARKRRQKWRSGILSLYHG